jgi:hypothetical protein
VTMTWYQRSGRDHDTHRGTLCRGRVQAACGVMFAASGTALPGDPPAHRICLRCGLGIEEHSEWLALLRVRAGAISKLGEVYLYKGRPFPAVSLIDAAPHRLATADMVTLTEPDRSVVSLTEAGQARYKTLDQRQRASADLPKPGRPPVEPSPRHAPGGRPAPTHRLPHTAAAHGRLPSHPGSVGDRGAVTRCAAALSISRSI